VSHQPRDVEKAVTKKKKIQKNKKKKKKKKKHKKKSAVVAVSRCGGNSPRSPTPQQPVGEPDEWV